MTIAEAGLLIILAAVLPVLVGLAKYARRPRRRAAVPVWVKYER